MSEGGRNFFVGAVSILSLVGFVVLLVLFGEVDRLVQPRYGATIVINDAGGIVNGSSVTLNGVPVGVVERVTLARDKDNPVRVGVKIDEAVQIPKPATASVLVSLLGGRSTLLLTAEYGPDTSEFYTTDGSALINGKYTPMLQEFSLEIRRQMTPILDTFEEFRVFAETYSELGQNINDLVAPGEQGDGKGPNLRELLTRLGETLEQVSEGMALAQKWLGDETMREDARATVAGARELMTRATDAIDKFNALAEHLDTRSEDLTTRLVSVSDELSKLLEVVHGLADKTAKGEGTLGLMITNPDLYNSLNDAAARLEQALREAQLLIQKLREEGVNIKL